ncbi:MAG: 30S ribosomal protein S18 [Deltaproteobacteria bacterium]|nr:30S ribosomal protein S18 [Deltaproteobacteria bacterium]MBI2501454.1 30S ribosomal protein S18 [Deltaproteobacteria bacterium]MBI4196558.1 30S ribosomal protein S18 [Deltaproteobacteria bacterium]
MMIDISSGKAPFRKKVCRFCADPKLFIDYKEPRILQPFTTERGKIIPRRVTGACAFHQRRITEAIKRARILALLPFVGGFQGSF